MKVNRAIGAGFRFAPCLGLQLLIFDFQLPERPTVDWHRLLGAGIIASVRPLGGLPHFLPCTCPVNGRSPGFLRGAGLDLVEAVRCFPTTKTPTRKFPPDKPLPPPHQRRKQSIQLYRRKKRFRRRWKHKIRLCLSLASQPLSRFPLPNLLRRQTALRRWSIPTGMLWQNPESH